MNFEGTSIFYLEHLDPEERIMWGMQLLKYLYENKEKWEIHTSSLMRHIN